MRTNKGKGRMKECKKAVFRKSFFLLVFLCISTLTGCITTSNDHFPVFSEAENNTENQQIPTNSIVILEEEEMIEITVASPLKDMQLNYLAVLYTAKKEQTGMKNIDFSPEYLQNIKPQFTVRAVQTKADGAAIDDIEKWTEIPDILYVNELGGFEEKKMIQPLTKLLADNSLFLPSNLPISALSSMKMSDDIYGIPFRISAKLLFSNLDILEKAGLQELPSDLDLEVFKDISETIFQKLTTEIIPEQDEFTDDDTDKIEDPSDLSDPQIRIDTLMESIYPLYSCTDFFPFLSASFNPELTWFSRKNYFFEFTSEAFYQSVDYLRSYSMAGYSLDHLSEDDKELAFSDEDPRLSGRVAMWIGDTKDLSYWSDNGNTPIILSQIPSSPESISSPPALTIYPLCVSTTARHPELASDFAAFIALDHDALLYQMRHDDGYFPVVDIESLWDSIYSDSDYYEMYLFIHENLRDAYYNPVTNDKSMYQSTEELLMKHSAHLLDPHMDMNDMLSSLQRESL